MQIYNDVRHNELIAHKAKLDESYQELSSRLNDMTSLNTDKPLDDVDRSQWEAMHIEHSRLSREIQVVNSEISLLEAMKPLPVDSPKIKEPSAMSRFLRSGKDGLGEDELESYSTEGQMEIFKTDFYASNPAAPASDTTSGQVVVDDTIQPRLTHRLEFVGSAERSCYTFRTATGGDFNIPQYDSTDEEGEVITSQSANASDLNTNTFTDITLKALTGSTKRMYVTREMVQDAVFDIESFIRQIGRKRLMVTWNKYFTANTGKGLFPKCHVGVTTASSTAFTYAELLNLIYSIDRAYREGTEDVDGGFMPEMGGMIGWMIHDTMEKNLRVMVDGDSRPLWQAGLVGNEPNRLLGYPYVVNNHLEAPAAGKISMLFGNFSYFAIRRVLGFEMHRFWDSGTALKNQLAFLGFNRADCAYRGAVTTVSSTTACEAVKSLKYKA